MIASLLATVRELGLINACYWFVSQLMARTTGRRAFIVRYLLVAQPVAEGALITRGDPATQIRPVAADDPQAASFPRPREVIARRYGAGDLCLTATVKERFAGFLWLAFGAYEEDEVRCRYQLDDPHLAWDYDVHVEPQYRLSRTFTRLWDAANAELRQRGIAWSLSRISAFNKVSLSAHARLGMRPLGYATFVCLGPLQVAFLPNRRLPHLCVAGASRPVLRLGPPETHLTN